MCIGGTVFVGPLFDDHSDEQGAGAMLDEAAMKIMMSRQQIEIVLVEPAESEARVVRHEASAAREVAPSPDHRVHHGVR